MRSVFWRSLQGMGVMVALGSLAACGGEKTENADSASAAMAAPAADVAPTAGKWTATLESKGGTSVTGAAAVMPGATTGTTSVELNISGAPANGVHPWHIHAGTCASGGDIAGPAADYAPLNADATGNATATATINMATPTSGDFHINVHMSPTDLGTIVACGDLKLSAM